jgi:primosomal protein N' (replication factor Y)
VKAPGDGDVFAAFAGAMGQVLAGPGCCFGAARLLTMPDGRPLFYPHGARIAVLTQEVVGILDYLAPEGGVRLGQLVVVPLGPRRVMGAVWGPGEGDFDLAKLRPVARLVDAPPLTPEMIEFLTRMGEYTLTPLPLMLRMATRAPDLDQPPSARRIIHRAGPEPERMTDARAAVLRVIADHGGAGFAPSELAQLAGVSAGVVQGLVKAGTLAETLAPRDRPIRGWTPTCPASPWPPIRPRRPSGCAPPCARGLWHHAAARRHRVGQDRGLSGGRRRMPAPGRQALVLLPEIALSAEFLDRVEARFGARPGEWHSGITRGERRRLWTMAAQNHVGWSWARVRRCSCPLPIWA